MPIRPNCRAFDQMVAGGVSMFIYRLHEIVEKQGVSGSNVCSLGGEILPIYVQYTPHLYIDIDCLSENLRYLYINMDDIAYI